ncbi:MAG: hypothetical protein V1738_00200 [Patescibacteria group bacterium]
MTDNNSGTIFEYPEELTTQYISTQDWPPIVTVRDDSYSCLETSPEDSSLHEIISQRSVDDRLYCINVQHEGAAGSVYSSYVYTTLVDDKLVEVSFTLRYSNCANYDDEQNQACAAERTTFDLDSIIDRLVRSIEF